MGAFWSNVSHYPTVAQRSDMSTAATFESAALLPRSVDRDRVRAVGGRRVRAAAGASTVSTVLIVYAAAAGSAAQIVGLTAQRHAGQSITRWRPAHRPGTGPSLFENAVLGSAIHNVRVLPGSVGCIQRHTVGLRLRLRWLSGVGTARSAWAVRRSSEAHSPMVNVYRNIIGSRVFRSFAELRWPRSAGDHDGQWVCCTR